jgi:hypothetical protein
MTETCFEEIILEFIKHKINTSNKNYDDIVKESADRCENWILSYDKIVKFEDENKNFLDSIFKSRFRHLEMTLNEIGRNIENEPYFLKVKLQDICFFQRDWCHITYSSIKEQIGLNMNSAKRYIKILQEKDIIELKKHRGMMFYSLKKGKNENNN